MILRQVAQTQKNDIYNMDELLRMDVDKVYKKIEPIQEKIDELIKIQNEKKAILNIPIQFEDGKGKRGKLD